MTPEETAPAGRPAEPPTRLQQPGRPAAEPPTRLQQAGRRPAAEPRTRVQSPRPPTTDPHADPPAGPQPGATRLQSGRRAPAGTAAGATAGTTADAARYIPTELRNRYVVGERLGAGGEATVWLAHTPDRPDVPVALKVYRPGIAFDHDLRRRLDDPALHRHVPRLYGYGVVHTADGFEVGWEAMEYFPLGTLADLVVREAADGAPLADARLRAIVAELVDAFDFWETTVRRRQTDVSPGNILVRSDGPAPQFVFGDFGGVLSTGASTRFADVMAKAAYMSPEALAGLNDPGGPYWSLGAICFEILTGRLIYGQDLTEDTIRVALVFDEPDVSALPEAWRDPVAGLLTRRPEDRWGAAEVRGWLVGRTVPVRRRATGAARLPVTFASTPYTDPVALAAAMVDASEEAAEWLSGAGSARLRTWLTDELADKRFDVQLLAEIRGDPVAAHVAVAAFAATYLPALPPRYRGTDVTVERLRTLAGDPARHPLLVEVVRRGVLPYAARHRCDHADCAAAGSGDGGDGGCRRLAALGRLLPRAVSVALASLAAVPSELGSRNAEQAALIGPGGRVLHADAAERDVCAEAVLLATGAEAAKARQRRLLLRVFRGPAEPWWQLRRRAALDADPTTPDGLAAIVVAEVLRPFAQAYRRALTAMRRTGTAEQAGTGAGTGARLAARAGRTLNRLDDRAGRHTAPWITVVLLATIEALGLAPLVRTWPATEPEIAEGVWRGVAALRPYVPDAVTGATDPLGAWTVALLPEPRRWLGPVFVAAAVVTCLALARKTGGVQVGARLVRVSAALVGRLVMAAYLLHIAVDVLAPVAAGLAATAPIIVVGVGAGAAVVFRPLTGPPRPGGRSTSPWPVRLAVVGGALVLTLVLLQRAPLPDADAPPSGPAPAPSQPSASPGAT